MLLSPQLNWKNTAFGSQHSKYFQIGTKSFLVSIYKNCLIREKQCLSNEKKLSLKTATHCETFRATFRATTNQKRTSTRV